MDSMFFRIAIIVSSRMKNYTRATHQGSVGGMGKEVTRAHPLVTKNMSGKALFFLEGSDTFCVLCKV